LGLAGHLRTWRHTWLSSGRSLYPRRADFTDGSEFCAQIVLAFGQFQPDNIGKRILGSAA
jgi:hypothetical protein